MIESNNQRGSCCCDIFHRRAVAFEAVKSGPHCRERQSHALSRGNFKLAANPVLPQLQQNTR
jgi:hypothetical protein